MFYRFVCSGQDYGDDAAEPGEGDALRLLAQGAVHALALLEHFSQGPVEWTRSSSKTVASWIRKEHESAISCQHGSTNSCSSERAGSLTILVA